MIGLAESMLVIAALFATIALISKDDAYSAFALGSAILFVALYLISEVSAILGIIVFAVYTGSVIALSFLGIGEENPGISRYIALAIPLAFAMAVALYQYMPDVEVVKRTVELEPLKDLIIPIAIGAASIVIAGQEVRGE